MRRRSARCLAISLIVLAACATGHGRAHHAMNVITRDEMLKENFLTVYDAIAALRSNWLNVRPNTFGVSAPQEDVVVYYDVTRLGGPGELKNISVRDIEYVQHLDAVEATQRYGVGHSQGVIFVSSHRP